MLGGSSFTTSHSHIFQKMLLARNHHQTYLSFFGRYTRMNGLKFYKSSAIVVFPVMLFVAIAIFVVIEL